MKSLFGGVGFLAATAVVLCAAPASVLAVNQNINLGTSAEPFCRFDSDSVFSALGNVGVDSTARPTSVVHIENPADSNGYMRDANFTYQIVSTCNTPSRFQLTSQNGGLTNPTPTPTSGSWLNRIDYSAHITLPGNGGSTGSLITTGVPGATSPLRFNGTLYSGNLQLTFQVTQNLSAPLLAGNYSDVLTIAVNPQ
jgi:hypothetical protein